MKTQTTPTKPLTKKAQKEDERAKAIAYLKDDYLKAGDTVYVILRHVGKTGMTRYLDLFCIHENKPLRITWNVGKALDIRYDRNHNALRIGGCGFCPAHQTVHDLAWRLFGNSDSLTHCWL